MKGRIFLKKPIAAILAAVLLFSCFGCSFGRSPENEETEDDFGIKQTEYEQKAEETDAADTTVTRAVPRDNGPFERGAKVRSYWRTNTEQFTDTEITEFKTPVAILFQAAASDRSFEYSYGVCEELHTTTDISEAETIFFVTNYGDITDICYSPIIVISSDGAIGFRPVKSFFNFNTGKTSTEISATPKSDKAFFEFLLNTYTFSDDCENKAADLLDRLRNGVGFYDSILEKNDTDWDRIALALADYEYPEEECLNDHPELIRKDAAARFYRSFDYQKLVYPDTEYEEYQDFDGTYPRTTAAEEYQRSVSLFSSNKNDDISTSGDFSSWMAATAGEEPAYTVFVEIVGYEEIGTLTGYGKIYIPVYRGSCIDETGKTAGWYLSKPEVPEDAILNESTVQWISGRPFYIWNGIYWAGEFENVIMIKTLNASGITRQKYAN